MAKTRSEIIGDIEDYIGRNGGRYGEWHVGVTATPKETLFRQHKLREKGDAWIARLGRDEYEARDIAEYFLTTRKARGKMAPAAEGQMYIYAFKVK